MSIRIDTPPLLALLGLLIPTATAEKNAGGFPGILLHTTRGYYGENPGMTSLLVGTSANGRVAGHTHIPCDGILEPTLIGLQDVISLRGLLAPRAKNDPNHSVDISRDLATITVQEPADLFDEGDTLTLHVGDLDTVPRTLWDVLIYEPNGLLPETNAKGARLPDVPRTDLPAGLLAPFVTVAKARNEQVQLYRTHQHQPILVQIGAHYRGVIMPTRWGTDLSTEAVVREGTRPDAEVFPPDLPPLPKKTPTAGKIINLPPPRQAEFTQDAEDAPEADPTPPGKPTRPTFGTDPS